MARILIVDDTRDMRDLIAAIVRMDGHEARAAASGREALDELADGWPQLVLLDHNMPEMNGIDVLRALRAVPASARLPVFMLTAHGDDAVRKQAMAAGADAFFIKGGFEIDDLLAAIAARFAAAR